MNRRVAGSCLSVVFLPLFLFLAFIAGVFLITFFSITAPQGAPMPPEQFQEDPRGNFGGSQSSDEVPPRILTATAEVDDRLGDDIIDRATAAAEQDTRAPEADSAENTESENTEGERAEEGRPATNGDEADTAPAE